MNKRTGGQMGQTGQPEQPEQPELQTKAELEEQLERIMTEKLAANVARVEAFFKKGTLIGKQHEAEELLKNGDTLFFDGHVYWGISIPYDRHFNGQSESMTDALTYIRNALKWLRKDIYQGDGETEVICYLKPGPETVEIPNE